MQVGVEDGELPRYDGSGVDKYSIVTPSVTGAAPPEPFAAFRARRMATVYTAIAAFENSARDLVSSTMLEAKGEEWWSEVKADIRNRAQTRMDNEAKHKFHAQRGDAPLNYTDLKDLLNIIRANWEAFEAFLPSVDWTGSVFDAVERSRNVIMHSGQLGPRDVERVGIHLRDWVTQVGT